MNWRWILMLAALGVVVSLATILGWVPSSIWLTVGLVLVAALGLGYNVKNRLFQHGFLTAAIWTLVGGALQFALWDTFIANHPEIEEKLSQLPEGMNMRALMAIGIVVNAAVLGVVLGLLTILSGKLLAEKPVPVPVPYTPENNSLESSLPPEDGVNR